MYSIDGENHESDGLGRGGQVQENSVGDGLSVGITE